jgi:hypothetical protein
MLNQPKEMNVINTKTLSQFFPLIYPFAPSMFFSNDTHACFALVTITYIPRFIPILGNYFENIVILNGYHSKYHL